MEIMKEKIPSIECTCSRCGKPEKVKLAFVKRYLCGSCMEEDTNKMDPIKCDECGKKKSDDTRDWIDLLFPDLSFCSKKCLKTFVNKNY